MITVSGDGEGSAAVLRARRDYEEIHCSSL